MYIYIYIYIIIIYKSQKFVFNRDMPITIVSFHINNSYELQKHVPQMINITLVVLLRKKPKTVNIL